MSILTALGIALNAVAAQGDATLPPRTIVTTPPDNQRPDRGAVPATRWIEIHADSPAERDAFVKARAVTQRARTPSVVPPLPEQTVSPPVSPRQ